MAFTVKLFGPNGCQVDSKQNPIRMQQNVGKQQELPYASIQKRKNKIDLCSEEQKKQKASMTYRNKAPCRSRSSYEIGPSSWIKKVITPSTLKQNLLLSKQFCSAIGLKERSRITLKTSTDSTESWVLHGALYNDCKSYRFHGGWRKFWQENDLKEGDTCTFNVIKTTLWHVAIMQSTLADIEKKQESLSATIQKRERKKDRLCSEERKKPKSSMTSLNKARFHTRCIFEIGPPAWMKKEMNTSTIERVFSLPLAFCVALGLREPCTVTLKTSLNSTTSWQARVVPYKNCNHLFGSGWRRFCHENRINEGDICTFNVVDTKLWHVVITHQ
ncbi:hypothetical protein HU200_001305 [Digitaria exilis]|uniref:TF-B3 domain-containing protein n=1 Tax=Digitaria exilis TaxID=1010633 RepID=A0A835KUZ2_9POAL|nr:hypothetical protein HU200_001305 [Digitaria exilis]